MSWLNDLGTWAGLYLAVGVGLAANDVLGSEVEQLRLLRESRAPSWFLITVAVILIAAYVAVWPVPAVGRTWAWVRERWGSDEDETEREKNE